MNLMPRRYIDNPNPKAQEAIEYAANALVQSRAIGGEDTDGKGNSDPINERRFLTGLIALYQGKAAPTADGRNPHPMTLPVMLERIWTLAYAIQAKEESTPPSENLPSQ